MREIAIKNLYPNTAVIRGDLDIFDADENLITVNEDDIQTEINRLQAEYDAQEYARNRKGEYPDIGDQLDDLFKAGAFSTEMTATIQAVKDKYPKE